MALKRGIVELVDYDEKWNEEYETEEELLKSVLADRIIEIHHIGSTSIKGLKAKPVIDILVVIKSLGEIPEIETMLKSYDYENRGQQGVSDRYFFVKGPEDARSHYVHFVEPNSNTYYNQVYFKKYLVEHPEYIKKYCDLKQELANKYADERPKYTKGKNDFITNVIKLAKEEYDD
ncbi:MAG: GrpB family protein [Mycoplasmatota bacterium]|nr:GrpB family protein [Mycoplasmatota bacterium]